MRTALAAALLVLCTLPASASELYIIPAYANQVSNGVTWWRSEVLVTNPHRHAVDLEVVSMLGATEPNRCRFPEFSLPFPTTLAAGQTRLLCMEFLTSGAVAFNTSDTLVVTSEMTATRYVNGTAVWTRQTIEPGRRWIEPGERGAIFNVRSSPPDVRANLVIVNPGDDAITVHYTMIRTGSYPSVNHDYESVEGFVEVAGKSVRIAPLPEAPRNDCGRIVPCGNAMEHQVVVEATGRFYAATSTVENERDGSFRSPVISSRD